MALPYRLLKRPLVIVKAAESTDRYGTTILDWANATRQTVLGDLQPLAGTEEETGRSAQIAKARIYLRPNAPVTGRDRIESGGVTYSVIGPPQVVARRGIPHHMVADVQAVEG